VQYQNTLIRWHVNIGVPSENYNDNQMRERFERAAQYAWYASVQETAIDIDLIREAVTEIDTLIDRIGQGDLSLLDEARLHPYYVNTHPEVIMEVVGYVKSPLGAQGTHLLVDVGAATLDVAAFRVSRRDGEDVYPILKSKVDRFGSLMLHQARMAAVKMKIESTLNRIYHIEPVKPLPKPEHYQVGLYENDLRDLDLEFQDDCYKAIGSVVSYAKREGDPQSPAWRSTLPVFLCGGGSKDTIYSEVISKMSQALMDSLHEFQGFDLRSIPKPETLSAPLIAPPEYNRLAVAYGLSFSSEEIGEIISEGKVPAITVQRPMRDPSERFVSKDQM